MLDFDNTFGTITITCDNDGCNNDQTFDGFDGKCDIYGTIRQAKSDGWIISRVEGEWNHVCPGCTESKRIWG